MSKKYGFTDAERYYGLGQKAKKPLDNNYIDSGNPYLLMDFAKKTDRAICDALNHNQIMKPNCRKVIMIRIPPNSTCSIDLNRPEFGLNCTAYTTTNQGKEKR